MLDHSTDYKLCPALAELPENARQGEDLLPRGNGTGEAMYSVVPLRNLDTRINCHYDHPRESAVNRHSELMSDTSTI